MAAEQLDCVVCDEEGTLDITFPTPRQAVWVTGRGGRQLNIHFTHLLRAQTDYLGVSH